MTLALAHLRRRRTQNLISVLGVAIGVMVLTTALSLTNGFVRALVEATIKALPHITLESWDARAGGVPRDPALEARLTSDPAVSAWSPYTETEGLLTRRAGSGRGGSVSFARVVGTVPEREAAVLRLDPEARQALEALAPDGILLGYELARRLATLPGDRLFLVSVSGADVSSARKAEFRVAGSFRTGNFLIDSAVAFTRLEPLAELRGEPGRIIGYHLGLRDPDTAPQLASDLSRLSAFSGFPWQDQNRTLIQQLNLQKLVISIVLLLLVIVAAFGIVNVLVLTVFEKTPEIAILRAMGASGSMILRAFLIEGLILGGAGLVLGNLLGLGLSLYFRLQPFPLPGDLYFISSLPVDIRATDFAWVSLASLATTLLAALVPARRAAAIEPARVIR